MAVAYIGLGANLGNRQANLQMALRGLTRMAQVLAVSSLYESEPQLAAETVDAQGQPPYYNAVCSLETGLEPRPLLRFLNGLEHEIGRRPAAERWAPRPIDLDILLYEERVIDESGLVIPHPRLAERAFALVPLAEIRPEARHPGTRLTAQEMVDAADGGRVKRIAEQDWDGVAGSDQAVRL